VPPVRALPHFQRPEAEPGAQPIIPEIADGAAQPRLISGGRAERDSEGEVSFIVSPLVVSLLLCISVIVKRGSV